MKNLISSKKICILLLIAVTFTVYSNQTIAKYRELSREYLNRKDEVSARRYYNFIVQYTPDVLKKEDIILDLDIYSYEEDTKEFLIYARERFEKYKYEEILRDILKRSSSTYFKFDELKNIIRHSMLVYPEDFNIEYFKRLVFFRKTGLDIQHANTYRRELKYYLDNYKKSEFYGQISLKYLLLFMFEFNRPEEALDIIDKYNVKNHADELKWFIDNVMLEKRSNDKYDIKDPIFKIFTMFFDYVIYHKDTSEELANMSKDTNPYNYICASYIFEEKEELDNALLNLLKAKKYGSDSELMSSILDDDIRRIRSKANNEYLVERVKHLIKRGKYKEAYTFTDTLSHDLNIFYKVHILFYYFHNYEKALSLIKDVNEKTIPIKYLEAEIYMKGFEYEKAEELFMNVYQSGDMEYYESSLFNLINIYKAQKRLDDIERLALRVYNKYGQESLSGRLFLEYVSSLMDEKKVKNARDVLYFILYSFSDNEKIYNDARESLSRLEEVEKLSSMETEYKVIMGYLRNAENMKKRETRPGYISPQERLRRLQEYRKQQGFAKIPEFTIDTREIERRREQLARYNFSTEEVELKIEEYVNNLKNQRIQAYLRSHHTNEVNISDNEEKVSDGTIEVSIDTNEIVLDTAEIYSDTMEISMDTSETILDTSETVVQEKEPSPEDNMKIKYSSLTSDELEMELVRVAGQYLNKIKSEKDVDEVIEYCERILKDSETLDVPDLQAIAIINLAQSYYVKYDRIDKVVEYFYSKLKTMLSRRGRKNNDDTDWDAKLTFYYKNVIDFFLKNEFYSKAAEIIDNYYSEVDKNYKNTEFLNIRMQSSLKLGEIDIQTMKTLSRKKPEQLDEFIVKNELFDRKELERLGGRIKNLKKTSMLRDEYKDIEDVKEKFRFFKKEDLYKHISSDISDIIGTFEGSREVYDFCRTALVKEDDIENLNYVLKVEKNRFNDFIPPTDEVLLVLENGVKNYPFDKVIELFKIYSPVTDDLLKEIDLSQFDLEFYLEVFKLNPESRFLGEKILNTYFDSDSSDVISEFIKKNPYYLDFVINHFIEERDYELADFYFNQYKGMTKKGFRDYLDKNFSKILADYRNLNEYRGRLNNSLLADYEIIFKVVDECIELKLYDDAKNYLLVYQQLTGKDVSDKIEKMESEKEIRKLKERMEKNDDDFILGKYLYLLEKNDQKSDLLEKEENKILVEDISKIIDDFNEKITESLKEDEDTQEIVIEEKGNKTDSEEVEVYTEEDFKEFKDKKENKKAIEAAKYLAEKVDGKYYYDLARLQEGTRDFKDALENYRKFILNDPDDEKAPESQYKIGLLNIQLNNINAANKAFTRLSRYFPDEKVYNSKAENKLTLIAEGKIKKEIEELDIIEKDIEYDEMKRFEDVSDNIDEIKEEMTKTTDPDRLAVLNGKLGMLYIEKFADYDTALTYLIASKENGDESKEVIEKIATCYIQKREYNNAIDSYRDYLNKLVDSEKKAYIALKIIKIYFENLKEYNKALEDIEIYLSEYDNTDGYYEALYLKGYIYENQYKDFTKAITEYTTLTNEFESEFAAKAQMRIAKIYEEYLKDYVNAKLAYEKIINEFADPDLKQEAEMSIRRLEEDGKI